MTNEKSDNSILGLTSGGLLARNTLFNLIGHLVPLGVAVFAIPVLIKGLGTDRFGVLTLGWAVIGYFSLFDLGIGRALTKLVADNLGAGQEKIIPSLVWTSLFLMLILGLVGALVIALLCPWLVHHVLKIPEALQPETLHAFYMLAFSVPVVISTAGLRGILEAYQCFGLINIVRIGMGLFSFLGPLLVLPFSRSLFVIVVVLAGGRLLVWLIHLLLCLNTIPALRHEIGIQRTAVAPLLRLGSWITVSNIVSPIMTYLDRFLIGALISIAAVAYYVTAYEIVIKLRVFSIALSAVFFPAFAATYGQDRSRTALLFVRGIKCLFLVLFPITLLIVMIAEDGLYLWLGEEFALHSTRVLQWLVIGVLINSLARVPFDMIQGVGRPDLTAKLHMIELPFYILGIWWMVVVFGIEGAAIVWLVRVSVDLVVLFWIAKRLLPDNAFSTYRFVFIFAVALLVLVFPILPISNSINKFSFLLMVPAFTFAAWFLILAPEERNFFGNYFKMGRFFKSCLNIFTDKPGQ